MMDLYREVFNEKYSEREWHMVYGERMALLYILQNVKPNISIEIGTFKGGSLGPISDYSKKVFTIDISDDPKRNLSKSFKNVDFLSGDSKHVLPELIQKLNISSTTVEFILVDGDHSAEGVKNDIETCLEIVPQKTIYMLMHDSFNPEVRKGIMEANWAKSQYLHYVEVDFVHGFFQQREDIYRQMWGGMALAVIKPVKRNYELIVQTSHDLLFHVALAESVHNNKYT